MERVGMGRQGMHHGDGEMRERKEGTEKDGTMGIVYACQY